MLAKTVQIDEVKLLGGALPTGKPKEEKLKEGKLYHDMSAARSCHNRAAVAVIKKDKVEEKLKSQDTEMGGPGECAWKRQGTGSCSCCSRRHCLARLQRVRGRRPAQCC